MKQLQLWFYLLTASLTPISTSWSQVPNLINYQGRVAVGAVNFEGNGHFKFALVNAAGTTTYWSNDGTSVAGSAPVTAVALTVSKGLYSVLLGDVSLPNMTSVPVSVFANADVRLRVWFNDGTNGFQLLTPDKRLAPNAYLPDASVTSAKLAANLTLSGVTTGSFAGSGTTAFQTVAGTSQTAVSNANYLLTNPATSNVTLPAAPTVGDVVRINGVGLGGWLAAPNVGQSIIGVPAPSVTWTALPGVQTWDGFAVSSDGTKLVAFDGTEIFSSSDSGASWISRLPGQNWTGLASSADGSKLVATFSGPAQQIYNSSNSGVTWSPSATPTTLREPASSGDGLKVYTAGPSGLFLNGVFLNNTLAEAFWKVACSSDGATVIARSFSNTLWVSTNSGTNFTIRETARNWSGVTASANGTKLVACVSGGQIYVSADSGVNWTPRATARDWTSVASSADGTKLVATVGGGQIYTSADSGLTWTASGPVLTWSKAASSADGNILYAQASTGQIHRGVVPSGASPLVGAAGTTVALQYVGGNQWQALKEASAATAASATTAQNFTGLLVGDVTGTQAATVVSNVGGTSAANVASGANLANAATSANTPNTLVNRDANGNFSAGTITGTFTGDGSGLTGISSGAGVRYTPRSVALLKWGVTTVNNTYAVGTAPKSISFDGDSLWVANTGSANVTKLNIMTGATIGTYAMTTSPVGLCFDGTNLWVICNAATSNLKKITLSTGAVAATYSIGVAGGSPPTCISYDGANLWIGSWGASTGQGVRKVVPSTGVATLAVASTQPDVMSFDGGKLWLSDASGATGSMKRINVTTNTVESFDLHAAGMCFDGTNLWLTNFFSAANNVKKISGSTGAVLGTYSAGNMPAGICFDGSSIWVANFGSDNVTKLNAITGATIATYAVGDGPTGICFDGANIWVTNQLANTVTRL